MKSSLCKKNSPFSYMLWTLAGLAFLLTAAVPALGDITQTAVVATSIYGSSSAVTVIPVDAEDDGRTLQTGLLAQVNDDITVSAYGRYFYLLARGTSNSVTKVDIDAPDTPIWNYSTDEDGDTGSNPYELVFVNSEKAYLIRYNSSKVWIVNPSAATEEEFKIGELDLSAYDEGDGAPEMAGGVIAGGKFFVMMQRLNYWAPNEAQAHVAVFDVETDTEIDTAMGQDDLKGIALPIWDPMAIQYLAENDTIYVQGMGYYAGYGYPDYEYEGGIVAIDPYAYSVDLILDDGDADSHPYGNISGMAIVSAAKGYFVGYDGWGDNTLYAFDPSAESITGTAVAGLQNKNIAGMESGIYADKNGILWVCDQTESQVVLLDTATDTIQESIGTSLDPQKVVFTVKGFVEDDDNENGIADAQEVSGAVDLDGDGVDDEITDTYKFLRTEVGEAQVALAATENVNAILTMASLDPTDALADTTGTVPTEMPYGLLDFSLSVPTGATAQVTLYFSEDVGVTQWYKYTQAAGWEDYSDNAVFSTLSDGRTRVVLTLEDGGIGDADGTVNGIIVDPSGPGTDVSSGETTSSADTASSSGGGSSTCFISSAAGDAPAASSGVLLILAMLLAAVPALRRSRK